MTIEQFNKTSFGAGMKIKHDGNVYDLISADFQEALIGFSFDSDPEQLTWARCENVEFI